MSNKLAFLILLFIPLTAFSNTTFGEDIYIGLDFGISKPSLSDVNDNTPSSITAVNNALVSSANITEEEVDSASMIRARLGTKAFENDKLYINTYFEYTYHKSSENEWSSTESGESFYLYKLTQQFKNHLFMFKGEMYKKSDRSFNVGLGFGAGLAMINWEESVDLNQTNYTWAESLRKYDNSTDVYSKTTLALDISLKGKYSVNEYFNFIGSIGYLYYSASELEGDSSNVDGVEKYEDVNDGDLTFNFGGVYFTIGSTYRF